MEAFFEKYPNAPKNYERNKDGLSIYPTRQDYYSALEIYAKENTIDPQEIIDYYKKGHREFLLKKMQNPLDKPQT